ncbi:MAG TPA: hypothetical protein VEY12_05445 [Thermoplasmata archaeon]|nr:hypothetical protein [Thermoplasmata archaeon]
MIARLPHEAGVQSPCAYEAQGVLVLVGKVASLEDQAGVRWPLGVLLRELAGKAVRLRVEALHDEGQEGAHP